MALTRRQVLKKSALGAVLLATPARDLLATRTAFADPPDVYGYGELVPDPAGMLDLPSGFTYRALSPAGELFHDATPVPGAHDGMGAFAGAGGTVILVRNHELPVTAPIGLVSRMPYDPLCKGGTSTLVVGDDGALRDSYVSLAGTSGNCAGGTTPWNTWLTCEETDAHPATTPTVTKAHGYVFEVDPFAPPSAPPVPLRAMGRFAHEAVAVDPMSGIVYETEDAGDPHGCFYRFRPALPLGGPGSLAAGGVLEVMRVADGPPDLSAVTTLGTTFRDIRWDRIPVPDFDPASVDPVARLKVRQQTTDPTRIPKCEGAYWGSGAVLFVSSFAKGTMIPTPAGRHAGQVWRYTPASNELTLVVVIEPGGTFDGPDNVVTSPYGGMFLCEDGDGANYVVGANDGGDLYPFARSAAEGEFCGACFDRTGRTMFVNVQSPGVTFAITGPWKRMRRR